MKKKDWSRNTVIAIMCNLNVCMQVVNFNLWYYSSVLTDSPIKFTAFLLRKIDMICAWYISKLSDIESNQDQLDQIASSWTKRKSNCVYVMIYWDQSILQLKPVYISASVTHSLCESDHWTSKKVYFFVVVFLSKRVSNTLFRVFITIPSHPSPLCFSNE